MSSNKSIRELMEKKYGKKCMMEEAGISYIPIEERRKIKGYKKTDEAITYHHMKRKCKGGQATEENGALLKWYNHSWLEKQSPATRERINNMLRRYKMRFVGLEFTGDGKIGNQVMMDLEEPGEFIEIPLYPGGRVEREEKTDIAQENMRIQNEKQWWK